MKKKGFAARSLSLLLVVIFCVSALPAVAASAAGDAMSFSEVKALVNQEELHPQRTGYPALDGRIEALLAPYEGRDAFTKLKALYDWTVTEIVYSWEGYSQDYAPAYDCFTLRYALEYETGLPKAYPEDMIYRAYHALTAKRAVCYDWGILFAVMARYLGIESYVHTGILHIGDWQGHHGWTELRLGGVNYIFDAQQDNYIYDLTGENPHEHFGIAPKNSGRWDQADDENLPRDASLLPVTAERVRLGTITVKTSPSGEVTGGGSYPFETQATLSPTNGRTVAGWYDSKGKLLSEEQDYTLTVSGNETIYARFWGDPFADVPAGAWFTDCVTQAAERGLINGVAPGFFDHEGTMDRAMMVTVLSKVAGADTEAAPQAAFLDVAPSAWYAAPVNWAYASGVVRGVSETEFAPAQGITREQAITMIVQYIEQYHGGGNGVMQVVELDYSDANKISPFARDPIAKAQAVGLISGYTDGTIRPKQVITRAEGMALVMNLVRLLDAA